MKIKQENKEIKLKIKQRQSKMQWEKKKEKTTEEKRSKTRTEQEQKRKNWLKTKATRKHGLIISHYSKQSIMFFIDPSINQSIKHSIIH